MADTKISALTGATTPLAGTEVVPLVQSSTTKNVSVDNLTAGRAVSAAQLDVDNIRLDANTISTTNTNGNLVLAANGTGIVKTPYITLDGVASPQIFLQNTGTYALQLLVTGTEARVGSTNNTPVKLLANAVARVTLASSGDGDVTVNTGNLIIGTSGKGIDFSANTGAAGMTSETLTWYEEGTWTPSIGGSGTAGTYELAIASGWYTRIGRQVTVIFNIKLDTSITGGGSGFLVINNLPFTIATTNAVTGSCMLGNVNFTSTAKYVVPATRSVGSTQLILEEVYANAAINDVSITIIAANNTIQGTITYLA